jgi:hypothetical protein
MTSWKGPALIRADVLATPCDLEIKGVRASIAGKTVPQVIIVRTGAGPNRAATKEGISNRSPELAESNAVSGISKRPVKH